jgi:hypothetical protein
LRPAEDLVLYRAEMAEWPGTGELRDWQEYRRDWVTANNACRRDILERLRADGPLPARELPDTCVQPSAPRGQGPPRDGGPPARAVQQRYDGGGRPRDRGPGSLARPGTRVNPLANVAASIVAGFGGLFVGTADDRAVWM